MKTIIILLLQLISISAICAQESSIICKSPRGDKVFKIFKTEITMGMSDGRSLASTHRTVTRSAGLGFIKSFKTSDFQYFIEIQDSTHFSDAHDYVIIRSLTGHETIYPLKCSY